ncbi:MAG TPA: helix-turn-helix domain-containing protein, partial [Tepidisphaeraceae bacterium]|nr:helix-turn-helix domain-containing protein [Tepidisphaeraceae bacterium]
PDVMILTTALTTTQAARKLGVSRSRILQLVGAGRLRTSRFGSAHMIREADLAQFRRLKRGRPRHPY